jgi:hypothetical protein
MLDDDNDTENFETPKKNESLKTEFFEPAKAIEVNTHRGFVNEKLPVKPIFDSKTKKTLENISASISVAAEALKSPIDTKHDVNTHKKSEYLSGKRISILDGQKENNKKIEKVESIDFEKSRKVDKPIETAMKNESHEDSVHQNTVVTLNNTDLALSPTKSNITEHLPEEFTALSKTFSVKSNKAEASNSNQQSELTHSSSIKRNIQNNEVEKLAVAEIQKNDPMANQTDVILPNLHVNTIVQKTQQQTVAEVTPNKERRTSTKSFACSLL